jgi:hypothetical protein
MVKIVNPAKYFCSAEIFQSVEEIEQKLKEWDRPCSVESCGAYRIKGQAIALVTPDELYERSEPEAVVELEEGETWSVLEVEPDWVDEEEPLTHDVFVLIKVEGPKGESYVFLSDEPCANGDAFRCCDNPDYARELQEKYGHLVLHM